MYIIYASSLWPPYGIVRCCCVPSARKVPPSAQMLVSIVWDDGRPQFDVIVLTVALRMRFTLGSTSQFDSWLVLSWKYTQLWEAAPIHRNSELNALLRVCVKAVAPAESLLDTFINFPFNINESILCLSFAANMLPRFPSLQAQPQL